MIKWLRRSGERPGLHIWPSPPVQTWRDTHETVRRLAERWDRYAAQEVDFRITEHDDMLPADADALDGYRRVGLSALQILSEAIVASGKTDFASVLDLPCGGGRITRHLRLFLPEAELFVADIDKAKEASVAAQFSAKIFPFPVDYRTGPSRGFDLIFSGSLLTHFDRDMFERALDFFVAALNPGGIAVLTLHGRGSASHSLQPSAFARLMENKAAFLAHFKTIKRRPTYNIDPDRAIRHDFLKTGFGYFAMPTWTELYKESYGGSYTSPAWIMKTVEARSDCQILGYKEMSYGNSQDVLLIQKLG